MARHKEDAAGVGEKEPTARAEFLIEPFVEGGPGPHVRAAIDVIAESGLQWEMGPFGTTVEGATEQVMAAVASAVEAALAAGATRAQLQVEPAVVAQGDGFDNLHGALDRLIAGVERDLGNKLADLDRESKQQAVRLLSEQGAFLLRKSVEEVADRMGVSRMSIYNYLKALDT